MKTTLSTLLIVVLMAGWLAGCATDVTRACSDPRPVNLSSEASKSDTYPSKIKILERRINDRDREISNLRLQLDSIRQIDMDTSIYKRHKMSSIP